MRIYHAWAGGSVIYHPGEILYLAVTGSVIRIYIPCLGWRVTCWRDTVLYYNRVSDTMLMGWRISDVTCWRDTVLGYNRVSDIYHA